MKKPSKVIEIFSTYAGEINAEIKQALAKQNKLEMYDMMAYFFGFIDEQFKTIEIYGGKRFRSGLCLLLADIYKVKDKAVKVAAAIEIFHNFTLIHDDIADNDPLRRGRPTVWKLWGLNHGINTGDGQLILANLELIESCKNLQNGYELQSFLNQKFIEVSEGQYLDFALTDAKVNDSIVTEAKYLEMITKKSSVLIGASTMSAGILAKLNDQEQNALWDYGLNLGIAYQLCDDLVSIWGEPEITGKISANDVREKKKTLPIIHLFNSIDGDKKQKLTKIYNKQGDLTDSEIKIFIEELNKAGAYEYTWKQLEKYKQTSIEAVNCLNISENDKKLLVEIVEALLPNVKEICKC